MERNSGNLERQICSIYGLTLEELAEIAKAKEEGRLVILRKEEPDDQKRE